MIECRVHSNVTDMQGKRVLVFLRPQRPITSCHIHAWQVLDISSGATASFDFDPKVSACLLTQGKGRDNPTRSAAQIIHPGQLFLATRPDSLSPTLEPAPTGMAIARLTPYQSGVYNQTYPYTSVDCVWHVSGSPVVTIPNLDWGMTSAFEYVPMFYFMIDAPLIAGENFTVQAFTDMTPYRVSMETSSLDVYITRDKGRWMFNFTTDLDDE
ncbi:hypothetical protein [Sulfuriflexus mobilis]|uniref:hypothetical protein n=1 Tax=Sulfuriflexus mobilis TaxID=1811807 RepID=UPI000F843AEA|nr:hypothetical protein [Sulfuriflexus mobilis]